MHGKFTPHFQCRKTVCYKGYYKYSCAKYILVENITVITRLRVCVSDFIHLRIII